MIDTTLSRVFGLETELALVTGGGSGLGLAVARCLRAAGARVVIVGRGRDQLAAAAGEIGAGVYPVAADITAFNDMPAVVEDIRAAHGPVSILVNNAGIHLKKPAIDTRVEEFSAVMDTHVLAAHNLTRLVLPAMLEAGKGSIVFTASMTSFIGMTQVIAYSAAKSAYLGMVRALSAEVAGQGVRVNAVAPGWIESPMLRQALSGDPARMEKILSRTPMRRFGEPDDIGWAVTYLCSPAARFISGVVLPVDGGAAQGF